MLAISVPSIPFANDTSLEHTKKKKLLLRFHRYNKSIHRAALNFPIIQGLSMEAYPTSIQTISRKLDPSERSLNSNRLTKSQPTLDTPHRGPIIHTHLPILLKDYEIR